jgi:hypothetical protein
MHDRLRKNCCRLIFLLAVAAPTVSMLTWGLARNTSLVASQTRLYWQQQLTEMLGMQVRLTAVETPRPGLTVLQSLQLSDRETGVPCGTIATVELWKVAKKQHVRIEDPQVQISEASGTWRWVVQQLLRRHDLGTVVISTGPLLLESSGRKSAMSLQGMELACHLQSVPECTTLTINMQQPGSGKAPVALQLRRQHKETVGTQVTLDTAAATLPCSLLVPLFPRLAAMGEQARFQGQLSAEQTTAGQVIDVAGDFHAVDLQQWLGAMSAGGLTGLATLHLQPARIMDDICVQASGRLVAENGMVKRSFLQRAAAELGLQWVHDLGAEQAGYDRLSCQFDLDKTGIQLSGETRGPATGVILSHPRGVLLSTTGRPQRLPSQALARSMGVPSAVGLPVSRSGLQQLQGASRRPVLQARPTSQLNPTLPR